MLAPEKLIERLADQPERQYRLHAITASNPDRKSRFRDSDRVFEHRGLAQSGGPYYEQCPTPAFAGVIEKPLQRAQHVIALSHTRGRPPVFSGDDHEPDLLCFGVGLSRVCG